MLDEKDLQAIRGIVREEIQENNKVLISAVGEVLEDNIVPQFNEVHRELRRIKLVMGL